MTEIQLFNNGEFELRFTAVGDSFRVDAPGLGRALGFRDAHDLVRNLPSGEKGYEIVRTPGGDQRVWHLSEPGFYRAIGQRQPARIRDAAMREQVVRFQDWVYRDVLPSIRRTGTYRVPDRAAVQPFGVNVVPPDAYTFDEVCGVLRQYFGISLTVNELTRNLRAGGVLKQNGAPTKKWTHLFWFTGTAWNVVAHMMPQVAFKVYDTGRELQDFRFLQMRLELEGVGQPPAGAPALRGGSA